MEHKAKWWCHCCGFGNFPPATECGVCKRHHSYVAPLSMSHRPLHGGIADCIRFEQFETILDKDMRRDAARRHLLRNGGMEESRLDAKKGDDEENALVRRCVDQLMNAADIAGQSVHNLRVGTGGAVDIQGVSLDNKNVIRSLTGITGERGAEHIKRRFRENSDVCIASVAEHHDDADALTVSSHVLSHLTDDNTHAQQHSVATMNPVVEDKKKWPMPRFVETSVAPKASSSSIVQKLKPSQPRHHSQYQAGESPSAFKQKSLERIHRLAKGIEKLEDPRDALLKKAFTDADDDSWTPLHVAAANGSHDLVSSLLHGGAMIEAKTHHGWRALHLAAASAHVNCVSLLLKHPKCDPNWITDAERQSALHLVAQSKGPGGGISMIAANAVIDEVITRLVKAGCNIEGKNFMGRTPLMEAAFSGRPRAVAKFLFLGANVHAEDNEGWCARQVAEFVGHIEVVDTIVNYLKMKNGPDKILPAPEYHSKYFNDAKSDFEKASKEMMKTEFRRETYKASDIPLREWALDIKFKKYMNDHGPGQSVFEYDVRQQRNEYNRTYFGSEEASMESSVSGLSEKSVNSQFYETRPFSPFQATTSLSTTRVYTAENTHTRPSTSLEFSSSRRRSQMESYSGRSRTLRTAGGARRSYMLLNKNPWLVREPYDQSENEDKKAEMKRTRDLREMERLERKKEFDKTMKPKASAASALMR